MKKKHSKIALIALFLALLYLPTLIGLVAGDRVRSENLENRTLTPLPTFSLRNIGELPEEYEAFYADNQPFRDQLIYARALINKALYDRDISQKVVFGKDDWLFYSSYEDGTPINSYRGEDLYTGVELRQIASNLTRTRDALKRIGCDFVLFIAPNKERVYSEYMPDRFGAPGDNYATKQLVAFLRQRTNLKVVYAYDDLMQAKQTLADIPIYYSLDTHWNHVGGYVGTRALMQALDIDLPELSPDMIELSESKGPNDLAIISHLTPLYPLDADYAVNVALDSGADDSGKKVVYFRHDSFGGYMTQYMEPYFSIIDAQKRDDEQVDAAHPDIFVMEVLERFVRRRLWVEPLYLSPEDRVEATAETDET